MGWYFENDCTTADELAARLDRETTRSGVVKQLATTRTRESGYIIRWSVLEATQDLNVGRGDDKLPVGYRWVTCDLMQRDRETGNWGYKPMDESAGPFYVSCPLKLIRLADAAGPAQGRHAAEWREKVRAHHGEKAAKKQADAEWFKVGGTAYIVNSGPYWNGTRCTINSVRPLRVSANYLDIKITRRQLVGTAPATATGEAF